jgi:hypothetical protein
MKGLLAILLILILSFLTTTEGKVARKVFTFQEIVWRQHWLFFTKFGMERGTGAYEFRTRLVNLLPDKIHVNNPIPLTMLVYLDVEWGLVKEAVTCYDKANHARARDYFSVPSDGSWSGPISSTLSQRLRDYLWYFVITDCDKNTEGFDNRLMLEVEITIKNSDESHFSVEENGMIKVYLILIVCCLLFAVLNSKNLYNNYKREGIHDYALGLLTLVIALEIISLFFDINRLYQYSHSGLNSGFNESMAHIFSIAAQFIMSCLLIFFSYGWTITVSNINNLEHFWPLYVMFGVFQVLIAGISRITDDERYKRHNYEGIAGIFIFLMKIGFYSYFCYNFRKVINESRDDRVKRFLKRFWFFGSVYFLAFPVLLIINTFVAPYLQHKFITFGNLALQILSVSLLSFLFVSKGEYYEISLKSKTILPSYKRD